MINKELFENIMKHPLIRYNSTCQTIVYEMKWLKPVRGPNLIWYKKENGDYFYTQMEIEIHKYLYKCKEWALNKGYEIIHMADTTKIYKNKYEVYNATNVTIYCLENFFKACEYILNNKEYI
jgi:hypothetical protein